MSFWKNKAVLITGANGFIGSNAVLFFSELGANVTAVVNTNSLNLKHKNICTVINANLLDPAQAIEVTKNQQIVLNFAAIDGSLGFKNTHSADLFSANMRINLNMLDSSVKNNIQSFLLVSSADIYSQTDEPITENTPISINWDHQVDGYKLAKWVSELASREFVKQYGLKTIIIRPSNLYGPGDLFTDSERLRFIPSIIKNTFEQKPISIWGNGEQSRSFLYISDFLTICQKLVEKEIYNNPINIAGSETITLHNLAKLIQQLTKEKSTITIDRNKPGGPTDRSFDLKKLYSLIGDFPQTDYKTGLLNTIQYYKKNHT